ncbi:MAG: hypothetical protein V1661_03240 [bacterium]
MKTAVIIGYWFVLYVLFIICAATVAGIIWWVKKKPKLRRLVRTARAALSKRYPYLNTECLAPETALQSPCCKTMLWLYDNNYRINYYCGHCGAMYNEKLERLGGENNLSALNESSKSLQQKINQ